jgi:hypothetical protein
MTNMAAAATAACILRDLKGDAIDLPLVKIIAE